MRKEILALSLVGLLAVIGCGGGEEEATPEAGAPPAPTEEPAPAEPAAQEEEAPPALEAKAKPALPPVDATKFITTSGRQFIDTEGREILLTGVNVVDKSPERNYLSWHTEEDFARLRDWGMNVIRLGIIWDGVEPEPGVYDDEYLAEMDKRVEWAANHGLYVFFDMHQDLYSVLYSDGAPEWATLTDGLEHIDEGTIWSDAYLTSPAIQRAFENFWANKPGPDGVGIQDHYAAAWRHVAERYADNPTVIGYDLMNEPFPGSVIVQGQGLMIGKAAELLKEKMGEEAPTAEEIIEMWLDAEGRSRLMEYMDDLELYKQIVDASAAAYEDFEKTQLTGMYQRVTNAIREVDHNHIIF
ncbi:MAG: cellulase family glycosylhydrolase, partial [Candidatus Hydrogenedentota bacterium]